MLSSPATLRNRGPILEVLRDHLPASARVLEIAAGSGEHAIFLTAALPGLDWQPTDQDLASLDAITVRRATEGPANLRAPVRLDAADPDSWSAGPFEAVVCINMVHISPWAATKGLMVGAGRVLTPEGRLYLYGPYRERETPFAPSNAAFDESLKARNPAWGVREREAVEALAAANDLVLAARVEMPANNLSLVFRRD